MPWSPESTDQEILSLVAGATADARRILTIADVDVNTPAPVDGVDAGYWLGHAGIIRLECRDDLGGGVVFTSAVWLPWFREENLSGLWVPGESFEWDMRTPPLGDGRIVTLNSQGSGRFWLQMLSKATLNSTLSVWAGVNTVRGA